MRARPVAEAGDSGKSIADPLSQRRCFVRRPRVETLSRLETELAAGDLLAKTRRWFGGAVDSGKELLGDGEGQIPACGLEDLEDTGHCEAAAKTCPDDRIDVPRTGDAGVHDRQRLAQKRHLETVADKTGHFSLDHGRTLPDALIERPQGFHCVVGSLLSADQLDQW